jgi:prepilin-type N-terminal cleavage/methylation domain-containing protein
MTHLRWFSNQRGFTLTELLVVASVLGLVLAGVFVLQREGQEAYLLGSNRVETQQNARVALDLMTRELRTASPDPAGPAPTGIVAIPSATSMTFRDQCGKNVQYALAGTLLNRTGPNYSDRDNCVLDPLNATGTTQLIGGVTSLAMTYCTAAAVSSCTNPGPSATTDPKKVAVIKVSIRTQTEEGVASGSPGDQHATMESTIKLRATLS